MLKVKFKIVFRNLIVKMYKVGRVYFNMMVMMGGGGVCRVVGWFCAGFWVFY